MVPKVKVTEMAEAYRSTVRRRRLSSLLRNVHNGGKFSVFLEFCNLAYSLSRIISLSELAPSGLRTENKMW